jgi:UTP--glucose-1-phosphate uridylyltransferase
VAGLGTRFLPATKSVPKELLPVVDKPLIQYAVEEAVEAGIDTIILITRGDKQAISGHFSRSPELEAFLESRGNAEQLRAVQGIVPDGLRVLEAVQEQPLGLGHAVLCARHLVGEEPFAVVLPDDMIKSSGAGCLSQMAAVYARTGSPVIGVEEIPPELTHRYGIAATSSNAQGDLEIDCLVEKPRPEDAPSNLGVVGRYILPPELFPLLEGLGAGAGGEIQLTDGIAGLLGNMTVLAFPFEGRRFDCGSRLGFVQATIDYALDDRELGAALRAFLERSRSAEGG